MSLNIELELSTVTERLEKVEGGQVRLCALLEQLVRVANNSNNNQQLATTTPQHQARKKPFIIKHPSSTTTAMDGKPHQVTIEDIAKFIITPYIKNVNTIAVKDSVNELGEISTFFLKYFILKRMDRVLLFKTTHWLHVPQGLREDTIKRLESFVRENLFLPLDKCEKGWAADFLLGWSWACYMASRKQHEEKSKEK